MDHPINLEKLLHMEGPLGLEEIQLVRKQLEWGFKPFEIPKNILKIWRKIGKKGEKLNKNGIKFTDEKKVK